ncbi:MAG: dihydroorotate dehydrogenase [Candidatus Omnitrophica bacterium]|nr:dihydroorotate dehydrogenase [Candidatus Omnitrophota bacterium]
MDLSVKIGKLVCKNPVMVASGTFGYAEEFADFLDLKKLGAVVSKTITLKPRAGNLPPRTCETPAGMLNSIGLENPGIEVFIKEKLPYLKKLGIPLIVSIASEADPQEFVKLAQRLDSIKEVSAIELNISCPNIKVTRSPGNQVPSMIAQDHRATYAVVKAVRRVTTKTLITKLSPNVTDIVSIACAAADAGTDALALINTLSGMAIDSATRKPRIAMISGGLSGPAIRPVAVHMVRQVYQKIPLPIIGMGGIIDASSALEFIIAGATAVSIGTANFIKPAVTIEVIEGLARYVKKHNLRSLDNLIGKLSA